MVITPGGDPCETRLGPDEHRVGACPVQPFTQEFQLVLDLSRAVHGIPLH